MRIACVYSVDSYATPDKPLSTLRQIPFGISIIATVLKEAGHDVNIFVISQVTPLRELFEKYIEKNRPRLFCLTAVSSQFPAIKKVAKIIKEIDSTVFVVLGGHHASLEPYEAIQKPYLDAICLSEGDEAVLELAAQLEAKRWPSGIPNFWIKNPDSGEVERNPNLPFNHDLDRLPYIDRTLWETWIVNPHEEVSVLVGRGCPNRCSYCSNHALRRLAQGKYVRYRSPENIIGEIQSICEKYPTIKHFYLEVETIGASITKALDLFKKLADYNYGREEKLTFWMNFAVYSSFMKNKEEVRKFFELCHLANVTSLNVGLESGSERVRNEILRRPKYTNEDLIKFSSIAREYNVGITLYVLIGIPGETAVDFSETIRVVRQIQPDDVYLSIFYPYPGTDLYNVAKKQGLIPENGLDTRAERYKATLDLPGFSKWRIRLEFVLFWYKVYKGVWTFKKIRSRMISAAIRPYPRIEAAWRYLMPVRILRIKLISHLRSFLGMASVTQSR